MTRSGWPCLRDVQVSDNQAVKAGQSLATIDDRDYVTALDQAKADVAGAQADIDNLKASLDQQQAVIAQARDTVNLDQANLTYAQQENDRYTTLRRPRLSEQFLRIDKWSVCRG